MIQQNLISETILEIISDSSFPEEGFKIQNVEADKDHEHKLAQ